MSCNWNAPAFQSLLVKWTLKWSVQYDVADLERLKKPRYAMRHLRKIYWLFWAGLPALTAYPVTTPYLTDLHIDQSLLQWERYWIRYTIALLSLTVAAFTLAGCLCCRKHRRTIGFQDKAGKCKQVTLNTQVLHIITCVCLLESYCYRFYYKLFQIVFFKVLI